VCEFCISHGEGKAWYLAGGNYSRETFRAVNSEERLREFLGGFRASLERGPALASRARRRFPRIYDRLVYPLVSRRMKRTHFGQVVPIEDALAVVETAGSVVRLPCVCRRVTEGRERRLCLGIGLDLTHIYGELPDYRNFERLEREEAARFLLRCDREGYAHSVWTFQTPFIGALCNCDRACMAYRFQVREPLGQVMWRAEYVARVDALACAGCGLCVERCHFGALAMDGPAGVCRVLREKCYGCGVCRPVCEAGAIMLEDRASAPDVSGIW
jgi:ferredoxin